MSQLLALTAPPTPTPLEPNEQPKALPEGQKTPPALETLDMQALPESPRTQLSCWDPRECVGTPHCPPRCPMFVDKEGARVRVRAFRSFDRSPLIEMYVNFDRAHVAQGIPPATETRIEDWLSHLLEDGYNLIAERAGTVVGHAVYTPTSDPEPELAVFVTPEYHDHGIGSELCKHVIAHAAAAGHDAIVLDVERGNRRATHVYARLGFEVVRTHGFTQEMRLELTEAVAEQTQRPPADRNHDKDDV